MLNMIEKRYLNIKELSIYLGFAVGTLYQWVFYKRIPYHKFGKSIRFDKLEIDKWSEDKKIKELD